ncbi:MAG: acyltransferase family protein, partial [Colwellia sp.]
MSSTERFEWVDYAKAIGIFLVVYGHVSRGLVSAGLMADSTLYQYADSVIYSFHMPLFFFLSGLFLVSSFKSK